LPFAHQRQHRLDGVAQSFESFHEVWVAHSPVQRQHLDGLGCPRNNQVTIFFVPTLALTAKFKIEIFLSDVGMSKDVELRTGWDKDQSKGNWGAFYPKTWLRWLIVTSIRIISTPEMAPVTKEARPMMIEVFKANVLYYPKSADVYASLGEAVGKVYNPPDLLKANAKSIH
jgi:hypothetical protein